MDEVDSRWFTAGQLGRFSGNASIFSVVTLGVTVLFALLGALELFEDDITLFEVWLSVAILVLCGGIAVAVIAGVNFPKWTGLGLVIGHALVSVYYLGFSDERQNAIAALQELPIMAFYLSWFFRGRVARITESIILVAVGTAVILGPFSGVKGLIGPANLIGAALFSWLCLELGLHVRHRLKLESHTDELTGVLNRRGFLAQAAQELRRATKERCEVSIALIDLDDFKLVNDVEGHAAGDDTLRMLTAQWSNMSRPGDVVGRLGGDEFAMLLPGTAEQDAIMVLQRLRGPAVHPWSWGVTQMIPGETVESALQRADAAMYLDKRTAET